MNSNDELDEGQTRTTEGVGEWRQPRLGSMFGEPASTARSVGNIYVGTSAWNDLGTFYPRGTKSRDQLPYYATQFPAVEINTTYYGIPSRDKVENWIARTPEGFTFDVKPPRILTSTPEIPGGEAPEPDRDLAIALTGVLEPLAKAGKLGAVTFQFPPSYRNTEEHRDYLKRFPQWFAGYHVSIEFRREEWLDGDHADGTLRLLENAGLGYTMIDQPKGSSESAPSLYAVTNKRLAIMRFHGRNARPWANFSGSDASRFDGVYDDRELGEWVPKLRQASKDAGSVHVFFNSSVSGHDPQNARRLIALLMSPEHG